MKFRANDFYPNDSLSVDPPDGRVGGVCPRRGEEVTYLFVLDDGQKLLVTVNVDR